MAPKKGGSGKGSAAKKTTILPSLEDNIVFEDDNKKKKTKAPRTPQDGPSDPSKPTARQIVGGHSWTGKLPVNLLSEHCQRQKWNKPDYSMRQMPASDGGEKMYRSDVVLSKTDPKTREKITLPPIRLPPSEAHLAEQPSALEARHFAATYALFRIQSMKNIHMTLPPTFRDLWKGEFSRLKKLEVDDGKGWRYDEDPFSSELKRQEIHKAMEKRKEEDLKKHALQVKSDTGGLGTPLPSRSGSSSKAWELAPQAAMGQQIRLDIEEIVREHALWNQHDLNLSDQQQHHLLHDVLKLGFRKSHIEEALEFCADKEEVLEWLLVHVPEDDLPEWTFPPNYNAGVTLASGDLEKEGKLKRLASAGYPPELCAQMLRRSGGDESHAAFELQQMLVPSTRSLVENMQDSTSAWQEETETLSAIFGDNFQVTREFQCSVSMSTVTGRGFTVRFRCPKYGYPQHIVPTTSIDIADVPAYIRLSASKNAIQYSQSELLGEVMIYSICQWLETELPTLIDNPGRLSELRMHPIETLSESAKIISNELNNGAGPSGKRVISKPSRRDKRSPIVLLDLWQRRQALPEQAKMMESRQRLPAWTKQQAIIQAIENHQITIISGETGSGKSTQVVQFILDNAIQKLQEPHANILCTQPRRVATLSLADRVSSERCAQVGDEVGYIIRGESKTSDKTKITFMTTGVLLRRLQSFASMKEALANVSHIFIDEVHERSLDTDFLLALLKECTKSQPKLRIVLMSATLDADVFSQYFGGSRKVALVHIEGRTFPVQDLYLEDVIARVHPSTNDAEIGKTIQNLGFGINYDLIQSLVQYIDRELGEQPGAILVFLPGTMEIDRCIRILASNPRILGLPLHASLLPAEQRKVFPAAPANRRKVVAATNVAETSITIEDIVAVIDTGRVKETNYDTVNNIVRLEEIWTSQAAGKQRRGRAGRVRAGTCYKLFTRAVEAKMPAKNLPEIQRVPLEQLCLAVKATDADRDVGDFLARTLTPPDSSAVANALRTLHTMNALENGKLTALGRYLAIIPADLRCAKLVVFGVLFDILEPCLTIASILTVRSPFVSPAAKREEANEARLTFPSANGDLMLDMEAYDEWSEISSTERTRQVMDWCSSRYISSQTMRDIASTRRQLLDSLKDAGLVALDYRSSPRGELGRRNADHSALLSALIAGALQPQLALVSFPSKKYIASMSGAKELDPEARTIKYFIPDESTMATSEHTTPTSSRPGTPRPTGSSATETKGQIVGGTLPSLSRVFVHPASCLFSAQTFPRHSTHLSYFTKMMTSKPFIRDLTPLNIYSLLLFGGKLELDTLGRGLTVGGIWRVRGWARIGVLISRLRVLLDEELRQFVETGGVLTGIMSSSRVVQLIRRLLVLNGQDQ